MKQGIHPNYEEIKITMTDGEVFTTRSTIGGKDAKMTLAVDPKSHPAYTGKHRMLDTAGRVDKFKNRYGM